MLDLHDSSRGLTYVWNESYTVNIYRDGVEVDCFTFGFNLDGRRPSFDDFVAAVNRRQDYDY